VTEGVRSVPGRLGIVALNLPAPGLGLLRAQRPRAAILLMLAPLLAIGLVTLVFALSPTLAFRGWAAIMLVLLAFVSTLYATAMVMTWRATSNLRPAGPWWSRWYGIAGILVVILALGWPLGNAPRSYYRTFYMPAESMAPTLVVDDRLVASMRGPGTLRRGDIILFDLGRAIYIKRVAALPGDRIAMRDGVVILNGRAVAQRLLGVDRLPASVYGTEARRFAEQFPGEAAAHQIYDSGYSAPDDMDEQIVAPGHVFVLGDNRDRSADSRVSRADLGVEQLPIGDIRGRALFHAWGPSGRMGEPLNR
jgi:signal peptidase I